LYSNIKGILVFSQPMVLGGGGGETDNTKDASRLSCNLCHSWDM